MKSPEGYEKDEICKYLDSLDVWYFKPFMAGYGKSGVSDIVGVAAPRGLFFCIEVKRPGKEPTPIQYRRIKEVELRGGVGYWGTAEKVIRELKIAKLGYAD